MIHRLALIAIAIGSIAIHVSGAEPKTIRLLTVGNSFSANATHYLGDLAKADGDTLILRGANVGGSSFEVHWSKVRAFEKDPTAKLGRYTSKSLKEELTGEKWDFVTIQQSSLKSHAIATYRPFAAQLRTTASCPKGLMRTMRSSFVPQRIGQQGSPVTP